METSVSACFCKAESQALMENFYSSNQRVAKLRILGGSGNIPVISPRVDSPLMSGKLRHKQFSKNPPTDYSPQYINILRCLQENSPSSTMQSLEEGTLVVDIIKHEVDASSPGNNHSRKAMHRTVDEPTGSYHGLKRHVGPFSPSFGAKLPLNMVK